MNEMVHEKVIAVLLIVGDIEKNDPNVTNLVKEGKWCSPVILL